ncbi:CoA-acylating methylmalonate-semialdehyde dehydrogenase [Lignipirellula cremea]|uniref:Methylmalonate semialdehyde dehydrogenase [acylating] n=1 Tax=Lignipirellula cremea TaxID=2528010 RepID=A0A518DX04_9BACT|nr:CoA-acylating methylmalonate-semialdehyde dehydrogenase [Lignipirellula cremea]QDU96365.1 Methylmalonate semialdehyde dehydrogenase [acylating] [Lignipirellula cremea]
MKYPALANTIAAGSSREMLPILSPLDGSTLSEAPLSTAADVDAAAKAAAEAQVEWGARTIRQRAQVFFRYRQLLEQHQHELAELIHEENGKMPGEGLAEIVRAIEVTEFACALPQMIAGEVLEVSSNVECRTQRSPLGVTASITPFNFPMMVPHWTIPIALCLGNAMLFKPSEKTPLSAMRTADLLQQAGLPDGLFSVVHGDRNSVEAICDHPLIRAVTFVGSTAAAKAVYIRSTGNLKRALCLGGAKNHLIVLPDAIEEQTAVNVIASMAGCAGQRCMAAASMIAVGKVDSIIDKVCEEAKKLVPGKNLGAVISLESKQRIERYIDEAEAAGARVLVDGRNTVVAGREGGYYVGPTVLDGVTREMKIAQDEVFGPVLAILRASDVEQAVAIENASPYGNAAAVYTQRGGVARTIANQASAGMIGVNIGVPVPLEPFGFGGWNDSRFGVGDITGRGSIEFWTQTKKITSRWSTELKQGWLGD